jgi:CDP-paratose 2-epimerase
MKKQTLITGGAGFIGSNYADHLLGQNKQVMIYDNLSRRGADKNLEWLRKKHGAESFELVIADVRSADQIEAAARNADVIAHLAGQVAVTSSVEDPRMDFEANALGAFNVLEAARLSGRKPFLLYSSTNKVYGGMEDSKIIEQDNRYVYADLPKGVSEAQPLDFHSPYGCSKGAADQYVRDYSRIYGIPTVVFRQSSIFGQRQFGIEDQGWLAWLVIAAVLGKPITIFGDGKQVRDLLEVRDLVRAYDAAVEKGEEVAGEVFNIGGGPQNTLSIWQEFGPMLEEMLGRDINVSWDKARPGDQKVYISDIRKVKKKLDWSPKISVDQGAKDYVNWVQANNALFA